MRTDRRLFEKLALEGFQAGLSWRTILAKRAAFRRAFHDFEPARVARFGRRDVTRLLGDAGIVRHRGKIEAAIQNARGVLAIAADHGSFARWVWRFAPAPSRPPRNRHAVPAVSQESQALAGALKEHGFRFVGPTTVYAFMQAMGLVNDHLEGCAMREPALARRARLRLPR